MQGEIDDSGRGGRGEIQCETNKVFPFSPLRPLRDILSIITSEYKMVVHYTCIYNRQYAACTYAV